MASTYCNIPGVTDVASPLSVTVNGGHDASTTVAIIETTSHSLDVGDAITIDMGTVASHGQVFTGYVKAIEKTVPSNTYVITANDKLVRALDYFIVSSTPETPLSYKNIAAETLVGNLLSMAGLTNYDPGTTSFTFGVNNAFEINQVSVYDYCRNISDLLTWHLWCDENGVVHFKNRKPFAMEGSEPQVDWVNDTAIATYTWADTNLLDGLNHRDDQGLRNRIVVYGANDIYAEASDDSIYSYHWKTAVLVARDLIDTQTAADNTASYNLHLLNHLDYFLNVTVLGDWHLLGHRTINVTSSALGLTGTQQYYIYSFEHKLSGAGYTTSMDLRRLL